MLYSDVFTTIHKHPLFMTPSCRTTFRLLTHISLLRYSISSNQLAFRRTLAHILQDIHVWAIHGPNGWKIIIDQITANNWEEFWSSHYSNYPWSFFVFMGNLIAHDTVSSLIYFYFIYTLFFFCLNLKDVCVNVV